MSIDRCTCPHCFRPFRSPVELSRHLQSAQEASEAAGGPAFAFSHPAVETLELWAGGQRGRDLYPGTREHRLFAALPEFIAGLGLPDLAPALCGLYATVEVQVSLAPCFALFDARTYRFVARGYNRIEIAYGLYQDVLDTDDDEQFHMLLLSQLLDRLRPAPPDPDTTVAPLVRHPALAGHAGTRGLLATQSALIGRLLADLRLQAVLDNYLETGRIPAAERDGLSHALLADVNAAALCNLTAGTAAAAVGRRLHLLARAADCRQRWASFTEQAPLARLWNTYLPLAEWIAARVEQRRRAHPGEACVLGLTGPQGSGKTTLNHILADLLAAQDLRTVGFSLDDLYRTRDQRHRLRDQCPHYRFRGPPGTHDVDLGLEVIGALRRAREGDEVRVPVFDKSLHDGEGDRLPADGWQRIAGPIDVVIFDGWCVGARPVDPAELSDPVNAIETSPEYDDERGAFRRRINEELRRYVPLFEECDDLLVLDVPNPGSIYRWRQLQETRLAADAGGGMDAATVRRFVDYYLPTTERYVFPLARDPGRGASVVLTLGEDHAPRVLRRFEPPADHTLADAFPTPAAEEGARALYRDPTREVDRRLGTAVLITDGVGLAPLDEANPLRGAETPVLDALAAPRWPRGLGSRWRPPEHAAVAAATGGPDPLQDAIVIGTPIHAASEELGLKRGQPGDSSVGHASVGVGAYRRQYISLVWEAVRSGRFADNPAICRPLEHVLHRDARYSRRKLHLWGMCSRGYIHSDIDVLFEIMRTCAERGLRREQVVLHVVTDGKDVPKATADQYVDEVEEACRAMGVGVIGTICGRDGWMCNRDRWFIKDRNAPAARCVLRAEGVAPDAPTAADALARGRAGESGRIYGDDLDRFLEPTHITRVRSQVESGDAMICFNLREDRSVIFPEAFVFPLVDSGELRDFLYATLIELRTLKTPRPYHLTAFRQQQAGPHAPVHLLRSGFVVRSFAESEKANEVSKGYVGGHVATVRRGLRALSPLLQIDTDRLPMSPKRPHHAPEMKAEEVAELVCYALGGGVALLANICNGDVIGHYGRQDLTAVAMRVVDTQIGRILERARAEDVVLLLTADHGCVESWGPTHTANQVPFQVVFPPAHAAIGRGLMVGGGVKALTDVEPTRFMLLGVPQPEHMTGDAILVPDISDWSNGRLTAELLRAAARNDFSLLRRWPDRHRIRGVLEELAAHADRQVVRMFLLRLHARLRALLRADCPFVAEFQERIPPALMPEGAGCDVPAGV